MTNEEILANAPKDGAATHILVDHEHHVTYAKRYPDSGNWFWFHPDSGWLEFDRMPTAQNIQSLCDIRRIFELKSELKAAATACEMLHKDKEAAERERDELRCAVATAIDVFDDYDMDVETYAPIKHVKMKQGLHDCLNNYAIEQQIKAVEYCYRNIPDLADSDYVKLKRRAEQLRQQLNGGE